MRCFTSIIFNMWIIRYKIDQIDDAIMELVHRRMKYVDLARNYSMWDVHDQRQEEIAITRLKQKKKIEDNLVEDIWRPLFNYSRELHTSNKRP